MLHESKIPPLKLCKRAVTLWIAMWTLTSNAHGRAPAKPRPALPQPKLQILVYNRAGVPDKLLQHAEQDTAYLLGRAGVEIEWIGCARETPIGAGPCGKPLANDDLVLSVQPHSAAQFDAQAAGYSQVSERTGRGSYASVFYDRVEDAARNSGLEPAEILGAVAAHEIGHLLLGVGSHSPTGIMRASWTRDDVSKLAQRQLRFTLEQAERMRAETFARTKRSPAMEF